MELELTENPGRFFSTLARDLKSLALSNIQYFQNGKQSHHAKFHVTFSLLYEYLDVGIEPSYRELSKHLSQYDFSPEVKGNGYRSLLRVVQKCCLHLLQLCRYISSVRDSILFRRKVYSKELESYVSALGQLRAVLYYALKLVHYCQEGELFADEDKLNNEVADQLVIDVETLCQESFFGRCLGFQFCESMQRPMQVLAIAMASYSEGYLESSHMMQVATSVFNSGKYILDPELRAQQMVKVTRTADIKFCKAFWGFSESTLMHQLPSFVCPSVEVNDMVTLGPDAFELPLVDGSDTVVITPPCAHTGPGHVHTRLISAHLREGQESLKKNVTAKAQKASKPKASGLIVHIHGGGFVAQSSKSHEVYLREWAVSVGVPILSVDYSLAPEAPFPRALEECFYAYAWAVQNSHQLGSTGETIVLVGDSAGANLAISTAMRAASFGIRSPNGIVAVYPCTVVRYTPSPARLLSLLDPILPVGLVTRCLAAYAGINEQHPLESPKMEDIHSHQSLSRIQMGTYETADNDWIIIAQDDNEVDKLRSQAATLDKSPDVGGLSGSVIDSMEDSFSGESLSPGQKSSDVFNPETTVKGRSDTVESEEVEIFSRLRNDGSCVFPSGPQSDSLRTDVQAGPAGVGSDNNAVEKLSMEDVTDSGAAVIGHNGQGQGQEDQSTSSGFSRLQGHAMMVMEGAHSVLSGLSSYIPASHDVSSSFSTLLSSAKGGTASTKKTELISDKDENSYPVDEVVEQNLPAQTVLVNDKRKENVKAADENMEISDVAEIGSGTKGAVMSSQADQVDSPMKETPDSDMAPQTSTSSSSLGFDTALSSPFSPSQHAIPGSASLDNVDALSLSSNSSSHHSYHLAREKTPHGLSSPAETVPGHVILELTGEPVDLVSTTPPGEAEVLANNKQGKEEPQNSKAQQLDLNKTQPDSPGIGTSGPSERSSNEKINVSQSQELDQSVMSVDSDTNLPKPQGNLVEEVGGQARILSSDNWPDHSLAVFSPDDLEHNQTSPHLLPTLPAERRQLLEDAMETVDVPSELSPMQDGQLKSESPGLTEGVARFCDSNLNRQDLNPGSLVDAEESLKVHQVGGHDQCDVKKEESININPELTGLSHTSTREIIKPPTSLPLQKQTNNSPDKKKLTSPSSPTTFFLNDQSEALQSIDPDLTFDKTKLEMQFASPSSDVEQAIRPVTSPSSSRSERFPKSGSAPALSALGNSGPSVTSHPTSAPSSTATFPNGIKPGMSPSDFHKQNFSAHSPLHKLRKTSLVKNPYMSPLLADDELLKGLPRVCVIGCHLDPLLDDSVMFARRLRSLEVPVDLHLIDDLPHGFLNFALLSYEAKQASNFCSKKIVEMLESTGV